MSSTTSFPEKALSEEACGREALYLSRHDKHAALLVALGVSPEVKPLAVGLRNFMLDSHLQKSPTGWWEYPAVETAGAAFGLKLRKSLQDRKHYHKCTVQGNVRVHSGLSSKAGLLVAEYSASDLREDVEYLWKPIETNADLVLQPEHSRRDLHTLAAPQ